MTIRQQGGVFGRNPTFNDVDTNDLTVEGQLLQMRLIAQTGKPPT